MFIAWQEPVLRDRGCLSVYRQKLDKSDNIEGGCSLRSHLPNVSLDEKFRNKEGYLIRN